MEKTSLFYSSYGHDQNPLITWYNVECDFPFSQIITLTLSPSTDCNGKRIIWKEQINIKQVIIDTHSLFVTAQGRNCTDCRLFGNLPFPTQQSTSILLRKASFCDDTENIANVFCTLFCSFVYSFLNTEYNKRVMKDQWWKVNKTTKENTLGTGSPVQSIQMQVYCFWDELCYLYLGWQAPFSKIMTSTEEKYLDLLSIFVCFIFLIQLDGTVWANGRVKKFLNLKLFPPQASEIWRKVNDNPKIPLTCNWFYLHPTSALVTLLLSDNAILCQLYKQSNMEKIERPKW